MSESEKKFLIRSSGLILGPFSKEEVVDRIKKGSISVFDEVAEPSAIWFYLQDHKDFKEAVYSVDFKSRLTNLVTQISGKISTISRTMKTSDKTVSQTKDTLSLSSPDLKLGLKEKQSAVETSFELVKDKAKSSSFPSSGTQYTSQQESEEIIRKKVGFIIKTLWQLIIISALSLGAYIVYKEFVIPLQEKNLADENFKTEGLKFYKAGDYKQALPYFESAYANKILENQEKLWLVSLFLQDNQLQKANSLLDELSNSSVSQGGEWLLSKGLSALFERDFLKAKEYFEKALPQKEELASVNLSLLNLFSGNYEESSSYLDRLIKTGYERGMVFYLQALNLLFRNQLEALKNYLVQDLALGQSSTLALEYQQELFFLLAYNYSQEQKTEDMEWAVKKLLNQDPFFNTEYQYSSFLAIQSLNWTILQPYCQNLFQSNPENSLLEALYGFCYLKTNNLKEGARFIEQAKNREPDNPLFLSLYAYLLMLKGESFQMDQALALIDYESLNSEQSLAFILKARLFESQQDWARALSAWRDLLELQPKHLSGLAGVSLMSYQLGDNSTAEIYKKKLLDRYPYHNRLLVYDEKDKL